MINFKPSSDESAVEIYSTATRLSPISKTKKTKVLADYGIKAGWAKGKSDPAISKGAADAVLKKFKEDQAKAKPPAKPTTPVKPVAAPKLTREQAAAIARKYKIDPAKLFGWGVKGGGAGMWINSAPAAYVWQSPATFEAWLKRAIRYNSIPK